MKFKIPFFVKIFIGLGLGFVVGLLLSDNVDIAVNYFKPIGDIYLRLLKFIIGPVVFLTVTSGISSVSDVKQVGRIGIKVVLFYLITTAAAVGIGLLLALIFRPWFSVVNVTDAEYSGFKDISFVENLTNMIPDNFIGAFTTGNMLQILISALFFGVAIIKRKGMSEKIGKIEEVVLDIMSVILKLSPLGVFGLIVPVVAQTGIDMLKNLLTVIVCIYCAFLTHIMLVYAPLVFTRKRISIKRLLKEMLPTMMLAFSTASSVSAISLNLECSKKLGAKKEIAEFVIPLGATVNMDGTGIYQGVCVVFIAACFGIELTVLQYIILIISVTVASIGTAGVPGAGILMLAIALESVGLPAEGVALVAGIDRIFDMGRTAVNVLGDAVCAVCVSEKNCRT